MNKILCLISIIYFTFSTNVFAAGWTDELTIDAVWIQDNLIVAETSGGAGVYYTGCVSSKYIMSLTNTDSKNQALSMLMTAAATGKKIKFWYQDNCLNWNYHSASAVKFEAS